MNNKKLLSIILIGTVLLGRGFLPKKANSYSIPYDKKLHFVAGAVIGETAYFIGPELEELFFDKSRISPVVWGIGMAGLAGAGKEIIYDKYMERGTPDKNDFYYTLVGGFASSLATEVIKGIIHCPNQSVSIGANPTTKDFSLSYKFSFN